MAEFEYMILYGVVLYDRVCEGRCESMTAIAQRLHGEYISFTQCLVLACCGEVCTVFTDKQAKLRLHCTQRVSGNPTVFGRCAGIAKMNVRNREDVHSTKVSSAHAQGC